MKIKKILIIIALTLSITFASLHYQQKRAEAIVPWVAYVAVSVAVSLVVGAILYLSKDSESTQNTITAVDTLNGSVTFDSLKDCNGNPMKTWAASNGLQYYPVTLVQRDVLVSLYPINFSYSNIPPWQVTQQIVDDFSGGFSDFGVWVSNCSGQTITTFNVDGDPNVKTDAFTSGLGLEDVYTYSSIPGGLGGVNSGFYNGDPIDIYDFIEDVPQMPDCFDGIQNQNETGIDCGGVCLINYGFDCVAPPVETCFDGIMNQDETGIDFGGVCGTGDPVTPGSGIFIDENQDNIDDINGLDAQGNIPTALPGTADASTYDTSLPGDVSEIGETDWSTLITDFISLNPLVALAQGTTIDLVDSTCRLEFTLWGKPMAFDFCQHQGLVDLFGVFVLLIFTVRSIFVALGV